MTTLEIMLISLIAIEYFYFMLLEMFLWTTQKGIKVFGLKSKEFAKGTKVMAANQGLYNEFLAAGLLYSIIVNDPAFTIFFLICMAIAGIYGAYSTKKLKLFCIQGIPANIVLILHII